MIFVKKKSQSTNHYAYRYKNHFYSVHLPKYTVHNFRTHKLCTRNTDIHVTIGRQYVVNLHLIIHCNNVYVIARVRRYFQLHAFDLLRGTPYGRLGNYRVFRRLVHTSYDIIDQGQIGYTDTECLMGRYCVWACLQKHFSSCVFTVQAIQSDSKVFVGFRKLIII